MNSKTHPILLSLAIWLAVMPFATGQNKTEAAEAQVKFLAEELEVSEVRVKQALGWRVKPQNDFQKAELAFYNASDNSPQRPALLLTWIETCQTVDEIRCVFNFTAYKSEAERQAFLKWTDLATTFPDMREAFFAVSSSSGQIEAFRKWIKLCSNQDEAREVFQKTFFDTTEEKEAFSKWLEFISLKDCPDLYELVSGSPAELRLLLVARWSELFRQALDQATDFSQVAALMIFDLPVDEYEPVSKMAEEKLTQLAWQEIDQAAQPSAAKAVYYSRLKDQSVKQAALLKWIALCESVMDATQAFNICELGSEAEAAAIRKIYELSNQAEQRLN